jgi:hypothetical protein
LPPPPGLSGRLEFLALKRFLVFCVQRDLFLLFKKMKYNLEKKKNEVPSPYSFPLQK